MFFSFISFFTNFCPSKFCNFYQSVRILTKLKGHKVISDLPATIHQKNFKLAPVVFEYFAKIGEQWVFPLILAVLGFT